MLFVFAGCLVSCDVLEPDADLLNPDVKISDDPVYVVAGNATFIDLSAKISTNRLVRFKVTAPPQLGQLSDLGKGLLQYTPGMQNRKSHDAFEFTIFSEDDKILKVDTVDISIEKDSTSLPCGVFPGDDYVYGVKVATPVDIAVLANDFVCGADSASLVVSVVDLGDGFPPLFGEAVAVGHIIRYTANTAFTGVDKIIYRVSSKDNPKLGSYGIVFLSPESGCQAVPRDDFFVVGMDSLMSKSLPLPVIHNDSACSQAIATWHIKTPAQFGTLSQTSYGFAYRLKSGVEVGPSFKDEFTYELCHSNNCNTAKVTIVANDSVGCVFVARPDSVNADTIQTSLIRIAVLKNDVVCDGYSSFEIVIPPQQGEAYVSDEDETIVFEPVPTWNQIDSLKYRICNSAVCDNAWVYIRKGSQ